jgi:hypothetical protein
MGHPARASPRPDESGQRRTSGRQESGGGGGDRSVDSAGEGGGREEVAGGGGGSRRHRSTGGEKEEEVVVAPLRRRPLCHGRRSSATADHIAALGGRSSPIVAPGAPPSSRPELLHHPQIRLAVLLATAARTRCDGRERWSRDGRGGGGRRRSVGRGGGRL